MEKNTDEAWIQTYAISKAYYDYLVSVLINQTGDKGLQGV